MLKHFTEKNLRGRYLLFMGGLMIYYSRFAKLSDRDRWLDLLSLKGDERVLDVGCGRGLMLVGAAQRLRGGKVVGIDIWQAEDQAGNQPEAALANARLVGVAGLVEVRTADMRRLPFPDQSFDVVVSHWAVHNLPGVADRSLALAEIFRVLKPSGKVLLADIGHQREYASEFRRLGLLEARLVGASLKTAVLSIISFGSFCPIAVLARKPGQKL